MAESGRHGGSAGPFFEGCPVMALITGEGGRIERANPSACEALGYTEAELQAMSILELLDASGREAAALTLAQVTAPGAKESFHARVLRKEGASRWIRFHCARSPDGASLFVVLLDIPPPRDPNEAQQSAELRRRAILQGMPIGVIELRPTGEVLSWNPMAERIFGYSAAEALGKLGRDLFGPPEAPDDTERIAKDLTSTGYSYLVTSNVTKEGQRITCEWHMLLVRDEAGSILSVAALASDITAHVEVERELLRSQGLLRAVLDNVPLILWATSPDGTCTLCEGLGLRTIGLTPGNFVGQNVIEAYGEDHPLVQSLRRSLRGERVVTSSEDLGRMWERRFFLTRGANGEIKEVLCLGIDITERIEAERELRRQIEIIEAQRSSIRAMSMPIIQVWDGVLALPVVGAVDADRAAQIMDSLLQAVAQAGARHAIVDLTGATAMDASTADHLLKVIQALELVGAQAIVTGIQPSVASVMTSLGLDLARITTVRNLREAIRWCMRQTGARG